MEAKWLNECGTKFVIAEKTEKQDRYEIDIEPGDYLVVEVGVRACKPAAKFQHPNIATTVKKVFGFKHYRKGGSKFWTEVAGVSHYFVVPRSTVKLIPEQGLSYIHAEINGVKVTFNVSGGGGSGVWTDWLHTHTQVLIDHPLRDIKKIAEVAVRGTPLEPIKTEQLDPEKESHWNQLAAKANGDVKKEIVELIESGKKPLIRFSLGYSYDNQHSGEGVEVQRGWRKHKIDDSNSQWKEDGAVKKIVLLINGMKIGAKLNQVDWYMTAQANRLEGVM